MNASSDVIVIGGGINGVSIAYHLVKQGIKVSLLEKSHIAGGPSGLSSAIVRQHYSNPITARMALDSLHFWQNFSEITGAETVFTKTGFLLGVRPQDVSNLKANIDMQRSVGINTRFISVEELPELEPHLTPTGLGGAAYEPEAGYCDPVAAANGFTQAAIRLGAQIKAGTLVNELKVQKEHITGVVTDQGYIACGKVIIAAGPWSPALLRGLGIQIPLITARVKVGLYRRPVDFKRHRIWGDFISQVYLRPETGDLMLVGSISPEEETVDQVKDPDHFNDKVSLDILTSFAERVAQRYPAMERSYLASNYASLYDISPDWHHILDELPMVRGLYLCVGSSGHGFKLAPSVGQMMTKLVLDGKSPGDEINLFSWDRFSTGNLVRGQYEYSILG